MIEISALNELEKVSETLLNKHIESWKSQGKKVLGYNCTYMPEEIVHAAGILPFRIRGTGCVETTLADSYLATVNCSFARACLELMMEGKYDFFDGAIFVYSCDHMCATHSNWKAQGKTPFMDNIISVPHTITEYGLKWFRDEICIFKDKLEEHFEVKITEENLKDAINTFNETRSLLKRLYELRRSENPPITGSQSLSVLVAGTSMPKGQYNQLLKELLNELAESEGVSGYKHKLMVAGSEIDDPALFNIIEGLQGLVVTDSLCFGTRSFWEPVKENGDPMDAISDRYYKRTPCPRMFDSYSKRLDFVKDMAKQADVDGIILESIKYCDGHGVDNVMLEKDLEEKGIPVLVLEREYGALADAGRIRTRVQAFLERIGR